MRRLFTVVCLMVPAAPAVAGIETTPPSQSPKGGVSVPEGRKPQMLECWIDGSRVVVESDPAWLLGGGTEQRVVVIRRANGRVTTMTITGDRARGCLPLAR